MQQTDPAGQLSLALQATGRLIAGIRDDQWTNPTPCTEWSVRDVVNHLVVGQYRFSSFLRGERPQAPDQILASAQPDLRGAYSESGAALVSAFRQPGVLERPVTVPIGTVPGIAALHLRTVEALVHGWDLARATGQATDFPEDLAQQELEFSLAKLGDIPPDRTPFAKSQPVAEDAPAIDRLAACLGRSLNADLPVAP